MDIRHFFQSVDHNILKAWLRKKFRDQYLLDLLFLIIDACDMGLALGYYTSQWLANFLLQPLDHYIKEKLHAKYMTRYLDDVVCFGANKKGTSQDGTGNPNISQRGAAFDHESKLADFPL